MKIIVTSALVFAGCMAAAGCGPNQRILESANDNQSDSEPVAVSSNAAPTVSTFERDLEAMRTADFKFIIVFRRKDGQTLDSGDKELLGRTAPQANRRELSDEGRAVIIGSNFAFPPSSFEALTERFKMENYSKSDSGSLYSNANLKQ